MEKTALSAASGTSGEPHDERHCRARQMLDRISDKWTLNVIHVIGTETKRFTVIKREIPGLSQRMLTVTLRNLERDGLVTRTVHPVVPPRVDYELTPLGHTLRSAVCGLLDWSMTNVDAIDRAREAYDARQADM
ncbi:winged helix-turn-helix transcriptional regulator [Herbidospora cretacea]|uniref:winged helix-turn-helix transcriptional regulator n=1 Tax=Herbidospora cretacea TaxID=28444 RepID=UPI0009DFAB53|nr:helix-turn-helix domain-containing protein [Herbidospora cretacea]